MISKSVQPREDNMTVTKRILMFAASGAAIAMVAGLALAAGGQYGPGASDTEIKIGNTIPYSGPA